MQRRIEPRADLGIGQAEAGEAGDLAIPPLALQPAGCLRAQLVMRPDLGQVGTQAERHQVERAVQVVALVAHRLDEGEDAA